MKGYDNKTFEYYAEQKGPAILEFYPIYKGEDSKLYIGYIDKEWGKYIILPLDTRQPKILFRPRDVKQMMWLNTDVILPKNKETKRKNRRMNLNELDEYLQKFGYELY